MRRMLAALAIGGGGLFIGMAGQAVFRHSPDQIWAACAVVGVLSAAAIAFESSISKGLARLTTR
ncbi:MAG: hypothetical protein ABMA15_30310 [Vicinamibacterales bacterium]